MIEMIDLKQQVVQAGCLLRQIGREFVEDHCTREANAMAYRTLFSAVPVLAIFLGVFAIFRSFEPVRDRILNTLYAYLVPAAGDLVRQYMIQFAGNIRTLGAVGIVGTLIVALYLFWAIEHCFNHIWNVDQGRGFIRKFTAFTALLLWAPILIGLSFYFTGKLHAYMSVFFKGNEFNWLVWLSLRFLPIFFSFLAMTIIYVVVPNMHVNVRAAAIGALAAATGWELVKFGFNFYVIKALAYSKVYGSLSVVPIFIIGLYLLWVVVFLGAEIAYVLHNYRYHEFWQLKGWSELKPYLAVGLMIELGKRFYDGKRAARLGELSSKFRVAIPVLREVFGDLQSNKLVIRMNEDTFFPAKSLRQVSLDEVIAVGVAEVGAVERMKDNFSSMIKGLPAGTLKELEGVLSNLSHAQHRVLGSVTLEDLVESYDTADAGGVSAAGVSE